MSVREQPPATAGCRKPRDIVVDDIPGLVLRALNSRGRTRTCDPTVNSRLLYQLSYAGSVSRRQKLIRPPGPVNAFASPSRVRLS